MEVLSADPDAGLGDVARASGLTRTTVYAHFAIREELLEELLRRAVASVRSAHRRQQPGLGPGRPSAPARPLRQLAAGRSPCQPHRSHSPHPGRSRRCPSRPAEQRLAKLLRRGRHDGTFRDDVSERWLLTAYVPLVYAAGREVATGDTTIAEAEQHLVRTVLGAFTRPVAQ